MSPRLKPYDAVDAERTKPSVMLLDWIGDDEVTVRWETVRRETPWPVAETEAAPQRWQGIGPRGGGIALGLVLGVSMAIGSLAFLLPQQEALSEPHGDELEVPVEPIPVESTLNSAFAGAGFSEVRRSLCRRSFRDPR